MIEKFGATIIRVLYAAATGNMDAQSIRKSSCW